MEVLKALTLAPSWRMNSVAGTLYKDRGGQSTAYSSMRLLLCSSSARHRRSAHRPNLPDGASAGCSQAERPLYCPPSIPIGACHASPRGVLRSHSFLPR